MFKSNNSGKETKRDFQVSLLSIDSESVKIRVGPRLRPLAFSDRFSVVGVEAQRDFVFSDFYSPDFDQVGQTVQNLYNSIKNNNSLGKTSEISRYYPISDSERNINSRIMTGGEFSIPFGKTFFWMKIPIGSYSDPNPTLKKTLEIYFPRIEYGKTVAANQPNRGNLFFSNVPIFNVSAKKTGIEVEYYEIGEVKYSSTNWIQDDKPVPYKISRLSSFFD